MRSDGQTLIGQPHLGSGDGDGGPRRWTLSDIRAHDLKIVSPNIRTAEELGLPSGDWSSVPAGDGSVPLELADEDLLTGAPLE